MKKALLFALLLIISIPNWVDAQQHTISGYVKDSLKGEELISATVRVKGQNLGARTNEYGFYSLTLPDGNYELIISAFGYLPKSRTINLKEDLNIDFQLSLQGKMQELKEVEVQGNKGENLVKDPLMGVTRLNPKELAKIPVLFGEKDIIKTMQLIPGVKSAGEGNSGYFVRGGGSDQNLILLDEAPVYNASHLLGFFSTFNSDAIKDAVLYKGNQPANFGGRLSSVLDIKMNEGNNKRFNVGGGLGLISSRLNIEGPLVKEKSSFLITARRTYADVFLKATKDFKDNTLYFYDLNTKLNYRIGKKDRLFLSGYFGRDKLGVGSTFGIDWGNATGTVRWNHIVNSKLFSNTSFIFSSYDYKISIQSGNVDFDVLSKVQDFNLKQEFQYFANTKNRIKFGANLIHHTITPGQIVANSDAGLNITELKPDQSLESAVFITNEYTASEKFKINYGLRGSGFSLIGNGSNTYSYDLDGNVSDTSVYKKNSIFKNYFYVEPRVSFSYAYSQTGSVKAAFSRNVQNIHVVSNSTSSSPTDVWLATSLNTKPEIADQVAVGWFKNIKEGMYEFSSEVYYKSLQNQIDYRNGANTNANDKLEGELLYGIGRAYGVELLLRKKKGKFSGWVGYTLSKTERQIDGINNNEWYNARQDRTHDISIVGIYDFNEKLSASFLFVYYTGNAVTFPSGKYEVNGQTQFSFTERNASRMPDYHRLDLGLTWKRKNTEKFESSWNFSLYNAYGRQNAYTITFRENENDPTITEAVQISLFRWIPAITYNFKFK
ncbi:MAG: TonB-dependent receptor [Bacteroidetes bacterium]|nr:MAG: TonB-dependent receptor [Bacteroidota bacterium]